MGKEAPDPEQYCDQEPDIGSRCRLVFLVRSARHDL
jgi:hypothetical protein